MHPLPKYGMPATNPFFTLGEPDSKPTQKEKFNIAQTFHTLKKFMFFKIEGSSTFFTNSKEALFFAIEGVKRTPC